MRLSFEDHAGFQRATLHVAVACSGLAAIGVAAGSERYRPEVVVLGAAIAIVAIAVGHLRFALDPVGDAVGRAAAGADAAARTLLARAVAAHGRIARAARAGSGGAVRTLAAMSADTTTALAALFERREAVASALEGARPADGEREALEAKRLAAVDPVVRDGYARAAAAARERAIRVAALESVVGRIDARALAAVTELEAAALTTATRDDLGPTDPAATLAVPCERLRAATADLGAEREAFAELADL
jgi:hypothetical protein